MGDSCAPNSGPDLSALLGSLLQNPAALSMLSSLLSGSLNGAGRPGGGPGEPGGPGGPCESPRREGPCEEDCRRAPPLLPPVPPKGPPAPPPDDRTCLLNALRPYLSPARCDTIDSLLRILELMELLRKRR